MTTPPSGDTPQDPYNPQPGAEPGQQANPYATPAPGANPYGEQGQQPAYGQQAPQQPAYGQQAPQPYGQQPAYGQQVPYGQAPYGQAPYGQAPYGQAPQWTPAPKTSGLAIASMWTSIGGLVTCGLAGVVGLILGIIALRNIKRDGQGGHGMALAGVIVGAVFALCFVAYIVIVIVAVAHGGDSGWQDSWDAGDVGLDT